MNRQEELRLANESLMDVLSERARQDAQWGKQNHDPITYLAILTEEVGELAQAALHTRFGGDKAAGLREEAVHTATPFTPEHYAAILDRDAALRRAEVAEERAQALRIWHGTAARSIERLGMLVEDIRIGAEQQSQSHVDVLAKIAAFRTQWDFGEALLAELEAARAEIAYLRGWIRSECSVADADINEAMAVDAAKAATKGTT